MNACMKTAPLVALIALSMPAQADYEVHYRVAGLSTATMAAMAPTGAESIACGYLHCYAIYNGNVWAIGYNAYGQLGLGDGITHNTWSDTGFAADTVVAGMYSGYAIKNGALWAVGRNTQGQLGLGTTATMNTWTATDMEGVDAVAGGHDHAYALKGGTIWSVGSHYYGQLGRSTPTLCGGTRCALHWGDTGVPAEYIVAGAHHGYALHNGTIWAVGRNDNGQLGVGSPATVHEQWGMTAMSNVTAGNVVAGGYHGYAIKGGTIWSVGRNNYGQLGRGGTTDQNYWGDTGVAADSVVSGYLSGYSIKDRTVWSVGYNSYGQLARSGTNPAYTWGDTGLTADRVIAGGLHAYALSGGNLWGVGHNTYGQAGFPDGNDRQTWDAVTTPFGASN